MRFSSLEAVGSLRSVPFSAFAAALYLVFTSLSKEALPMIRYRTRDLTRLLPPTSRSFRRMGKIVGRSDDMLIIHGTKDEMIPFEEAKAFAENNVITFIPIEGANHPFQNPKQMALAIHEIVEFFGE